MARISRRYVIHAVNASLLATALAVPAGMTVATAEPRGTKGGTAEAVVRSTEPPPSDPGDGPTTTPPAPPPSEPGEPDSPTTSSTATPDGTSDDATPPTSDDATPPTSGETDGQTSEPPPEQETETDEVTTGLAEEKEQVPEELAPAVDTLLGIIGALDTPETSPQDREGVIESAENLSTALAAINDPRTPPELRERLIAIVKQVTSTLEVVAGSGVPDEEQSLFILVVKRTTSALDIICDPGTREELRRRLIAVVGETNYALERGEEQRLSGSASAWRSRKADTVQSTGMLLGASADIVHDRRTPPKEREELAEVSRQVSSSLRKITDPRTSQKERSEAEKEMEDRTARMKDQQEESASARKGPKESLGEAAAVCSSAIFESVRDSSLMGGLRRLVPAAWEDEGVKDFWKAREKSDDQLEVLAQLRNNERSEAPFEVVPLITALAELVPRDKLYGSLGGSSLSCTQTAKYLEERFGVTAGSWLTRSGG
ncbi:hypothetical protein [Streptomyces sp. NPDC048584]|uniref:hypothetical protein n=1 Tax=Streptomyces sp. NPDC048584 TaxID=3365573 RepID=UPI003717F326